MLRRFFQQPGKPARSSRLRATVETLETRALLSFTVTNSFGLNAAQMVDVPAVKPGNAANLPPDNFIHDFSVTITNDAGLPAATINAAQRNADGTVKVLLTGTVKGPVGFGTLNSQHTAVLDFYANGSTTTSLAHVTNFTDQGIGSDNRDEIAFSTTLNLPGGETSDSLGLIFTNTTHEQTPLIPLTTITVDSVAPTVTSVGPVAAMNLSPVDSVPVTLSDPITASSFGVSSVSLTRDGVAVPLSNAVTVSPVSGSTTSFTIAGLSAFTGQPGNYVLSVNAANLHDAALNPGTGTQSVSFAVVNVAPTAQITVGPTKFPKKGPATFMGTGSDANPLDTLQFGWTATISVKAKKKGQPPTTKLVASGTGTSFALNVKTKGVYTVTLTVTDNHGATGTAVRQITHK